MKEIIIVFLISLLAGFGLAMTKNKYIAYFIALIQALITIDYLIKK